MQKGFGYTHSLDWTDKRTTGARSASCRPQYFLNAEMVMPSWMSLSRFLRLISLSMFTHLPFVVSCIYIFFFYREKAYFSAPVHERVCSQLRTYILKSIRIIFNSCIFSLSKSICIQYSLFLQWPEAIGRGCVYVAWSMRWASDRRYAGK